MRVKCFSQLLAIVNKVTIELAIHLSLHYVSISFGYSVYTHRGMLDHMVDLFVIIQGSFS